VLNTFHNLVNFHKEKSTKTEQIVQSGHWTIFAQCWLNQSIIL